MKIDIAKLQAAITRVEDRFIRLSKDAELSLALLKIIVSEINKEIQEDANGKATEPVEREESRRVTAPEKVEGKAKGGSSRKSKMPTKAAGQKAAGQT